VQVGDEPRPLHLLHHQRTARDALAVSQMKRDHCGVRAERLHLQVLRFEPMIRRSTVRTFEDPIEDCLEAAFLPIARACRGPQQHRE
jgi:hypothetical protein